MKKRVPAKNHNRKGPVLTSSSKLSNRLNHRIGSPTNATTSTQNKKHMGGMYYVHLNKIKLPTI